MSFHRNIGGLRGNRTFNKSGDSEEEFGDSRDSNRFRRDWGDFNRHFSPSVRKSGEEILRDLKTQLRRDGDMFFNNSPSDWGFGPKSSMFSKAEEGDDGRRGVFRVPGWGGDDSVSQLAARMSQTPPLASAGRRGGPGPWRERRGSGGSAMSATSEDSCDAPDRGSQGSAGSDNIGHEIPIRLEAPAPPMPQQQMQPQEPQEGDDSVGPLGGQGRCPLRTTSAVNASEHSNDPARNSRCASAPPEVAQAPEGPARFVSKISITPQQPQGPQGSPVLMGPSSPQGIPQGRASPLPAKFNTVPRPFVPAGKTQQDTQPQQQQEQQPWQQQQQYPPQDSQWQFQDQPYTQYPQQQQQYPPQQQQHPQQQQQFPPSQFPQEAPPQPPQRGQRPSIVRNIPIFVEGRDDPSDDPRAPPQWQSRQPQPQQFQQPQYQQPQPQYQQPQPQYQLPQPQFQPPQQPFQQPPQQPQFQQPQQKPQFRPQQPTPPPTQPIPQPVPMPMPQPYPQEAPQPPQQQQQQQQQQEEAPEQQPPQQPQQPDIDPRLVQIAAVAGSVAEYSGRVAKFNGAGGRRSKEFLYLDEMLTRALLQLDNVDPNGRLDVRQARRAVIKEINSSISALEAKAVKAEEHPEQPMETQANEQQPVKNTDIADNDNPSSQGNAEPSSTDAQESSNAESSLPEQKADTDSQQQEQKALGTADTSGAGQTQPSTDSSKS